MRKLEIIIAIAIALSATTIPAAQAEPRTQSGKPAACKAPSGESFGLGETIDLPVTDGKGNIVKVTYLCTEQGWVKVSKATTHGGGLTHIGSGRLQRSPLSR